MKCPSPNLSQGSRAMTLLELVVVIAIMAVLTTVAVRSLNGMAQQSRFESTQRTLGEIREAILGAPNDHQPNGNLVISGFVADIGRPPLAKITTNLDGTFLTLDELLFPPNGGLPFDVRPAAGTNLSSLDEADAGVLIPCGWRGPYLRLAVGANEISDGWGMPIANAVPAGTNFNCLAQSDASPVSNAGDEAGTRSPGADSVQGGNGYDGDLSVTVAPSDYTASLAGPSRCWIPTAIQSTLSPPMEIWCWYGFSARTLITSERLKCNLLRTY